MTVDLHHAETHLAELIAAAEAGEEVLIARGDGPRVKLTVDELNPTGETHQLNQANSTATVPRRRPFVFGRLQGKLNLLPDWEERFDAMDDEITSLMCDAPFTTSGDD